MKALKEISGSLLQLVFPHICSGCGSDVLDDESELCLRCLGSLPATNFHWHANNPVEKVFWGRLPLASATSQYYFTKESLIQNLMHSFKYRGNIELGKQLGRLIGLALRETNRFDGIDAIIPLPLFPKKERKRGYNQAAVLGEGMSEIMKIPSWKDVVIRTVATETQTKKGRLERWENIEGKFEVTGNEKLNNKHILLVDDVVTTGATLESCGSAILQNDTVRLSVATLCYATK